MARALVLSVCFALVGCDTRFSFGAFPPKNTNNGGADGGDGGACVAGPSYELGDGPGIRCESAARRAYRFGLCSCDDVQNSGGTFLDAFDSERGAYTPGDASGSLGANGAFYPREADIGGSVWVKSTNGIPLGGDVHIGGNLYDQGQLDGVHAVIIDGDAFIGGQINVRSLQASPLTVAEGASVQVTEGVPELTRGTVDVELPCDCEDPLDVPALVRARAADNDNASIGLDPNESMRSIAGAIELTLPCGRYYIADFYAPNPVTLTITGPVELYIAETMVAEGGGNVQIQFTSGGELDLFVEKGFSLANRFEVGTPNAPKRARIYAGGEETLFFAGPTSIGGTFYAPAGQVVSSGPFEIWGAMFVRRVSSSGPLTVHYDRALARDECDTSPCTDDCGTLACIDGACRACRTFADCAPNLRCDQGLCLP